MAELLSVHVHIPQHIDISENETKNGFRRENSGLNGSLSNKGKQNYNLPRKRNLDIEFRDLKYTVKDGPKGTVFFYGDESDTPYSIMPT